MSRSCASSSRWTNMNEELEHLVVNMPKLTIEEHGELKELTNMMQHVVAPPETSFQTVSARDQIFGEVGKIYVVKWKDVLDNLDQPAIIAGWIALHDFYRLTGDHLVSLHHYDPLPAQIIPKMTLFISLSVRFCDLQGLSHLAESFISTYYFLTNKGWTHLYLEDVAECRLVFNHWRKSLKIRAGWKHFCETLSFTAGMEIVFEFIDPDVNCVLYWSCL
ncbi:hypothetical protein GmHk_16G047153 [Glycine max]|nr:hypothetical protein GmHk_16G047153 [Glycine max]